MLYVKVGRVMKRGLVVTVTKVHLQVVAAPRLIGVEGGDGVVRSVEGVEGKEAHAKIGISGRYMSRGRCRMLRTSSKAARPDCSMKCFEMSASGERCLEALPRPAAADSRCN